jgi:DNA repair protein RecO (recombination protein O)
VAQERGTSASRWDEEPAYVLHTYPYKETSLIVEMLTQTRGRIATVAKGAKRPTSALRGLIQPFLALQICCSGKGEVKALTKAEWCAGHALVPAHALMAGFYMNELVMKLLPRDDPHAELFNVYAAAVGSLASSTDAAGALRKFELNLLRILGYGLDLEVCTDTNEPIRADRTYGWAPERGVISQIQSNAMPVSGAVLLGLAGQRPLSGAHAHEAKHFMRCVLDFHLERRALSSRQMAHEMQTLLERE